MKTSLIVFVPEDFEIGLLIQSLNSQSRTLDELIFLSDNEISIAAIKAYLEAQTNVIDFKLLFSVSIESALNSSTGNLIFFSQANEIWDENKIERFVDVFMSTNCLISFSDARYNGASFLDVIQFKIKEKLLIKEGKSDQVFSSNFNMNLSLLAIKRELLDYNILPFDLNPTTFFSNWLTAISSSQYPERIEFLDEELCEINQFKNNDFDKLSFLERVLERVENRSFRRAHYFWYMRDLLPQKSFGARFISINTLFLEGDYKRLTNRPLREALRDLRG